MTNEITQRLEHEHVGKLLLHYAIPAVIGTVVNSLYNIIDRIFIGQGVGALAISGLALTFPILIFMQAFGMLVGAGASARISIYLGRKENDRANHVLGNALMLTFLFSALTIIPGLIFMKDLLLLFGGSEQTIPYAEPYLYITIPGNLLAALSFSFNGMMRASGYPKKAMVTMLAGAVLNIILDPIFIFVFDLGIKGAAIATVISMSVSAAMVMSHFVKKDSIVRFHSKYFKLKASIVISILTIGMSPFAMQLAGSAVNAIMNTSLVRYGGDLAVGAFGITMSFALLLVMLVLGVSQGMQPIVGFNYGAKHYKRVLQTLKLVIIVATGITSAGFLCGFFIPQVIVRAFTTDPELTAIAENGMRITFFAFTVVGFQMVTGTFFQSIGVAWKSMLLSVTRQCLFLIPALLIVPLHFGLDGVWMASPIADTLSAVVAVLFLYWQVKKLNSSSTSALVSDKGTV